MPIHCYHFAPAASVFGFCANQGCRIQFEFHLFSATIAGSPALKVGVEAGAMQLDQRPVPLTQRPVSETLRRHFRKRRAQRQESLIQWMQPLTLLPQSQKIET